MQSMCVRVCVRTAVLNQAENAGYKLKIPL